MRLFTKTVFDSCYFSPEPLKFYLKCPFYEILSIDFNITYDIVVRTKQITIDFIKKTTLFHYHCYGKCFEINSLCFIKKIKAL